ncbi:MAG: phosphate ABC transporter ATP-binding protein [Thermoproteota archaeon]|jgi:phosphate transport system ATP-binding protein|uniref:Phosphate ABC transporter ATP-binding protein n=1 Tax=Candidatus Methanodesulfokora washburnensis TaxID=2478471 RepID=A0A429GN36_9CREN|nr:phosphate ABC transporter ATP-binding protein PstB [Candidatus Methanodesulfokores washburnensis]RSN75285.1 phosphate ABC transporter ATP-binding protein [Candidatus Methanodesulfokores washburnensis]RZN61101.1 MAG: phosphate ABC transporter ATP-binding protein [Candidatus Methanodesulfokores washburnensis]TDA42033.1 MAG: phosphate ABC transporter ATP-binding protein [Candidatus Korarchaeota archaeon]
MKLRLENVNAWIGRKQILYDVNLGIEEGKVTAVMGPSGCGKTTLLRVINRMHEEVRGARVSGTVLLDGEDVYKMPASVVRRRIGMIFQKPNPFPNMSIFENVAIGLKLSGIKDKELIRRKVREALEAAALWDEVKDELDKPGTALSGGQQQRLCIARALAVEPEVILMDEPTSALDPIATSKLEELIRKLSKNYTVVIVTHNVRQAARVSDYAAFIYEGRILEFNSTAELLKNPRNKLTESFITGRFEMLREVA